MKVLKRAKELVLNGVSVEASKPFDYFLKHQIDDTNFGENELEIFSTLDDYDLVTAMKAWMTHDDVVLSNLSKMIINRELLKIKLTKEAVSDEDFKKLKAQAKEKYNLSDHEVGYFVFQSTVSNQAYDTTKPGINIIMKNTSVIDVT